MISFEKEGWVSLWIGWSKEYQGRDVLKDLCGVDYYDVDFQEILAGENWELTSLAELLGKLSYSRSYLEDALKVAKKKRFSDARYVVMQLDFKYDPKKTTKEIKPDPVFLGAFRWSE